MAINNKTRLENSIREQFPSIFLDKNLVSEDDFYRIYNEVAEYLVRITDSPLKPETYKYQTVLLSASLSIITFVLFNIDQIKIGDINVHVNDVFLFWYVVFIFVMSIIYILRVNLDYKIQSLARKMNHDRLYKFSDIVQKNINILKIQQHFWLKLSVEINNRLLAEKKDQQYDAQSHVIVEDNEIGELRGKSQDFKKQIKSHESFLELTINSLNKDIKKFRVKLEKSKSKLEHFDEYDWDMKIHSKRSKLFDAYLRYWKDITYTFNFLSGNKVTNSERFNRLNEMYAEQKEILDDTITIDKKYFWINVTLPVFFAWVAIAYTLENIDLSMIMRFL